MYERKFGPESSVRQGSKTDVKKFCTPGWLGCRRGGGWKERAARDGEEENVNGGSERVVCRGRLMKPQPPRYAQRRYAIIAVQARRGQTRPGSGRAQRGEHRARDEEGRDIKGGKRGERAGAKTTVYLW